MSPIIIALLAFCVAGIAYALFTIGHRGKHLPPGPPTFPILGNIPQIPLKGAHFQFTKWSREYGGLYTLKLGSGTAAVITDRRLVKELVDRRSSKYSERPKSYVANLIANGDHILLMDYGPQWRDTRKLLHNNLMEKVVDERCVPLQEAEAKQLLHDYLIEPQNFMEHPKRYSNSITMSLIWGVRTPTTTTRHMTRLYSLMEIWSKVMEQGATPPVDIFPWLHYLPQSVFLNWVDRATHVRDEMNSLYRDFLHDIRARRAKVGKRDALMDQALDQADNEVKKMDGLTYSDHELYFMGGTLTEGGSDTSASIILAFVHAMIDAPEIQRKAQAEIDAVVGPDRSPTWKDYSRLPYVAQCVKEAMRWRPVTPLAFPHALAEDDWIDGYFLPKGTVIIVNVWGLHHDENRFQDPDKFDPDHYAGVTTLAPELANGDFNKRDHYAYGTGRRFCPGAHLAERNLFLAISSLFWGFDILPGKNEKGEVVKPDPDPVTVECFCEGFLVAANPYLAEFKVRGEERRKTILREFENSKSIFEKYEPIGTEKA